MSCDPASGEPTALQRRLRTAATAGTAAALWPRGPSAAFAAALQRLWPVGHPCRILIRPACLEPPPPAFLGADRPIWSLHTGTELAPLCAELGVSVLAAEAREEIEGEFVWVLTAVAEEASAADDPALQAAVLGKLRLLGYI